MPFQSEAQRRWMHANHPAMAKRWEAHTPKGKKLPKRKGRSVQNLRAFARRKRLAVNVFCPTGEGGGVDPTCSPGGYSATVYRGVSRSPKGLAALGTGTYYALDEEGAQRFSKPGTVLSSTVSLKNPIVIKSDEDMERVKKAAEQDTGLDFGKKGNMYVGILFGEQPGQFTKWAKSKGYDGIVTTYKEAPGGKQVLVFNGPVGNARRPFSPYRSDPSRTAATRKAFFGQLRMRLMRLKGDVLRLLVAEDALGTRADRAAVRNVFCPTGEGGGIDPTCSPGATSSVKEFQRSVQAKMKTAELHKRVSDVVTPQEGHVYRFVTGEDYDKDLAAGKLSPGRAADTGGTVNFSKEPIPVYGASAWGRHGLLVEVPEANIPKARMFAGSKDLYLESPAPVPFSKVSRAWAVQFQGGFKAVDITDQLRGTLLSTNAAQWRFLDEPGKASSFAEWLAARLEAELFDEKSKRLWHAYARAAFDKGAKRSFTEAGARLGPKFSFVQMLLSRKDVADKVHSLGQRNVSDLAGIAEHLKAGMQRAMLDGIARKDGPAKIAKALNKVVDDGIRRAKALANANTVRAHADGQLWGFSQAGAKNLKVMVEWVTTGLPNVCEKCQLLESVVFPIEKAYGLIPLHVGCMCAFMLAEPTKRRFLADEDREELRELFEDMF